MSKFYLLIIPLTVNILTRIYCYEFQCNSQISMDPDLPSKPQYVGENPPPYSFGIFNANGEKVKEYREDIYTVRLSSNNGSYFRSFLLQARLATKHGHIIGQYRAGEFVLNENSANLKLLPCSSFSDDSITNSNDDKKISFEAKWSVKRNEGPIQFLITIIKEPDMFWISWAPKTALFYPDKDANFGSSLLGSPLNIPPIATTEQPVVIINKNGNLGSSLFGSQLNVPSTAGTDQPAVIVNKNELGNKLEVPNSIDGKNEPARFIVSGNNQVNISKDKFSELSGTDHKSDGESVNIALESSSAPLGIVTIRQLHGKIPHEPVSETPVHILEEHLEETFENITEAPVIDPCESDPCFHNGTCESFMEGGIMRFSCNCASPWLGEQCEEPNYCYDNKCKNRAACVLSDESYTCQCRDGFGGKQCEYNCPSYLCQNGGSCVIDKHGEYKCNCRAEWTGEQCEKELDPCLTHPCQNGGNCTRFSKSEFECKCKPGFYGDACHRACQDVYKSCEFWKQEDKCDLMRPTTSFFDINCPVSCDQCIFDNKTKFVEMKFWWISNAY